MPLVLTGCQGRKRRSFILGGGRENAVDFCAFSMNDSWSHMQNTENLLRVGARKSEGEPEGRALCRGVSGGNMMVFLVDFEEVAMILGV